MSARPPPTRPHIFSSYATANSSTWTGDEDAWDSGSDHEGSGSSTARPKPQMREVLAPGARPVSRPPIETSSSSLAFSYTHISVPSPSSYPPRPELSSDAQASSSKAGWMLVSKSPERKQSGGVTNTDHDLDNDLVIGDFDADLVSSPNQTDSRSKTITSKDLVRPDAEKIVNDPLLPLRRKPRDKSRIRADSRAPSMENDDTPVSLIRERSIKTNRRRKFSECALSEDTNIVELRKLAWNGIPAEFRPVCWQLLLGYMPLPLSLRASTLKRKRAEYQSLLEVTFARGKSTLDQPIWHQIEIDVPRTRPGIKLWMEPVTQKSLERILYVWAIRHPASGYVQGINDLVTPFFQLFLSYYLVPAASVEEFDPSCLPESILNAVEADSFWCLSRLLDGIQDNYVFAQPGIQRSVKRMEELVSRIDPPLIKHFAEQNVEFMQFSFRWMNCLLMREMSVDNTIRMWDTYLAEGPDAFSQFHLYVCSALLVKWSEKLRSMDFQGIIMFLQSLPTQGWTDHDIELLVAEAFLLNSVWHHAQSHLTAK